MGDVRNALADRTVDGEERRDAFLARVLESLTVGAELLAMELGRRLGLYDALLSREPLTPAMLSRATGITERYATEWLEQQAAAGILDVPVETSDPLQRRFTLPMALRPLFEDPENPYYLMGIPPLLAGLARALPEVADDYPRGRGVAYHRFGRELRQGIAMFNRPGFATSMGGWIDALPEIADRVRTGCTVLDVGCGVGWSTIAIARAFPRARVIGVDLDEASIVEARANADHAGLAGRVEFSLANATGASVHDADLVTVFEALHDMGEPIDALVTMRRALAPGGAVLIADERVADRFVAPASPEERLQYAFSVLHCLPATLAESANVANGTVLRAPTVHRWAAEAGFSSSSELPIEHEFWRFYELR